MKKYFTLLLLTFVVMSSYAYDVIIDGVYYDLIPKAKVATVSCDGLECYSGDIVIPSIIEVDEITYTVTAIGEYAFGYCQISSISIPNSVTSISDHAFERSTISSVTLPNSVKSIGNYAFSYSDISNIDIPNSVISIGSCAFSGCNSLTSIKLPSTITNISSYLFSECYNLTSVLIPESVTRIYDKAFYHCYNLNTLDIPEKVTIINDYAFKNCWSLTSLQIPKSVTTIGFSAFDGCTGLSNVIINCDSKLPEIKTLAFANCSGLETMTIISDNAVTNFYTTASNAFENSYIEYATLYVPEGSDVSGTVWENFGTILPYNTPEAPTDWSLTDGNEYSNLYTYENRNITYTRNFTNTNWNALYVPFAMQYDDWSADFEIARLNDVHQFDDDEDGEIDRTVLESVKLKAGSSVEPNTPYMIKAKEAGEKTITLTDATLYATAENSFDVTSWYTKFTFTGTYSTVTDMATRGHFALANGGLKQASSDAATLSPFRWYLDITDRNGNPTPLAGKKVFLSFDDGETTELKFVEANDDSNYAPVYSISGVNVGNDKASLPKGLYISNGKKFVIK